MVALRYLALVTVAPTLLSCGAKNSLEGSISESFSLDFDTVRVRKQDQTLRVEWLKEIQGGTNKICQVVVEPPVGAPQDIADDLLIEGQAFLDRVTINRVAAVGGDFPAVKSGNVEFNSADFVVGGRVDGSFECVFDNGRTLSGNFDGQLEEVPLN